jgi:Family of unknown function (DUF6152)
MRNSVAALAIILVLGATLPVLAHHSHANYDQTSLLTLDGTLKEVHWSNPHTWIYLNVKDDAGVTLWALEAASPTQLFNHGWSKEDMKAGDTIRVRCNRLKDGGNGCLARFVTLKGKAEKEFD